MLFKHRDHLHPRGREGEEHMVIQERKEDPVLAADPITAHSLDYRPSYWW